MSRKFGPKIKNHSSIGRPCPVCKITFKEGDYTGLIVLGPGDEEAKQKAKEGKAYNAVAVECHWDCMAESYKENFK